MLRLAKVIISRICEYFSLCLCCRHDKKVQEISLQKTNACRAQYSQETQLKSLPLEGLESHQKSQRVLSICTDITYLNSLSYIRVYLYFQFVANKGLWRKLVCIGVGMLIKNMILNTSGGCMKSKGFAQVQHKKYSKDPKTRLSLTVPAL